MRKKKDLIYWNIPVDKVLNDALEEAIKLDWHRTRAEFIRGLVRRKLEALGFSPPRPTLEEVHARRVNKAKGDCKNVSCPLNFCLYKDIKERSRSTQIASVEESR